jgi:hypothetical protein
LPEDIISLVLQMQAQPTGLSRPPECGNVMAQFPATGRNSATHCFFFTSENKKKSQAEQLYGQFDR